MPGAVVVAAVESHFRDAKARAARGAARSGTLGLPLQRAPARGAARPAGALLAARALTSPDRRPRPQVHVFKKKVRKRYSKLKGHRPQLTALRVLEVLPEGLPDRAQREGGAPARVEAA